MKELNTIREALANVPNLNSGGCAIAALLMFRYLEQQGLKNESTMFAFVYRERDESYLNNLGAQIDKQTVPMGCLHCFILHEGRYYDSNLSRNSLEMYAEFQIIKDESFIVDSINNSEAGWNPLFDRFYVDLLSLKYAIDMSDINTDMFLN